MAKKPTYQELQKVLKELEKLAFPDEKAAEVLQKFGMSSSALIRHITDAVFILNKKGQFEYISGVIGEGSGISPEKLIGSQYLDTVNPEDKKRAQKYLRGAAKGEETPAFDLEYTPKDGKRRVLETQLKPIFKGKRVIGLLGVSRNVTEQTERDEETRKAELAVRSLLNATTESAFLTDNDGVIITLNSAAGRRLAKPPEKLIGKSLYDFFPPEVSEPRKEKAEEAVSSGKAVRFKDKREDRWFDQRVYPIRDDDRKTVQLAIYSRDITRTRIAEEGWRDKIQKLEKKNMELEEVAAALRVLLKKKEEEAETLNERVRYNVKQLILPYLNKLGKTDLNKAQIGYLNVLETNLGEIVSTFSRGLASRYFDLTPAEIQIANFLRQGKKTKEIAQLLNLSKRTVETHRRNIRTKLGMKNRKANLRTHLLSFQ